MSDSEKMPPACPNCNHPISVSLVGRAADQSRTAFSLSPSSGELMRAETVGHALIAIAKMEKTAAREFRIPTEVLLESVQPRENGEIKFNLLLVRFEGVAERKARLKAKREGGEE